MFVMDKIKGLLLIKQKEDHLSLTPKTLYSAQAINCGAFSHPEVVRTSHLNSIYPLTPGTYHSPPIVNGFILGNVASIGLKEITKEKNSFKCSHFNKAK